MKGQNHIQNYNMSENPKQLKNLAPNQCPSLTISLQVSSDTEKLPGD